MWKITVPAEYSRVPWNELIVHDRNRLQEYLDYLHILGYTGPGQYVDGDGNVFLIEYKEVQ